MRLALLLLVAAWPICAQTQTRILDTIKTSTGANFNGKIQISNPPLDCSGTVVAGAGSSGNPVIEQTITNGALDITLYANAACVVQGPGLNRYTVRYLPSTGGSYVHYWDVPASGAPLLVSQVYSGASSLPLSDPTMAVGDILVRGSNGLERVPAGAAGRVLRSTGPGNKPEWQTVAELPSGGTISQYLNGLGTWQALSGITLGANQITSGTFADSLIPASAVIQHQAALTIAATQLTGLIPAARLGTGTANNGTCLRGDGTWAACGSGGSFSGSAADIVSGTMADARIAASNVTQHQSSLAIAGSQITSGTIPEERITVGGVTQHQAALALAASQLSSGLVAPARLGTGTADNSTCLRGDNTWGGCGSGSFGGAASEIVSGTFADARIAASNVTQHQAALTIAATQLTGTLADARVAASNILQHQAALAIAGTQLTGTVPTARLGSGTANNGVYLRGDNAWSTIAWGHLSGVPSTFVPAVHSHEVSEITGPGRISTSLLGGGTPTGSTYLRGDGEWATIPEATGDVTGPASVTTLSLGVFDGTTGKLLRAVTGLTTDTAGKLTAPGGVQTGDGAVAGFLDLFELTASGSNRLRLRAPDSRAADLDLILPTADPTSTNKYFQCGAPSGGVSTCLFAQPAYADLTGLPTTFTEGPATATTTLSLSLFADTSGRLLRQVSGLLATTGGKLIAPGGVDSGDGTVAGEITLQELLANGSNFVRLKAPDSRATDLILLMPTADPTAGQTLVFSAPSSGVSTGTWATPGSGSGTGDVVGPASATNTAVVVADGTTGKLIKDTGVLVDGSNNVAVPGAVSTGNGSLSGRVFLYEESANGSEFFALVSPVSRAASLAVVVPSTSPAEGQILAHTAPSGGVSAQTWVDQNAHNHPASAINSGTLPPARGGLGADTSAMNGVALLTAGVAGVVPGTSTDCVKVNGTSGPCGTGGGSTTGFFTINADFGIIPDLGCLAATFTATGIQANATLAISSPPALEAGLFPTIRYFAADTVALRLCNMSGSELNPASHTFNIRDIGGLGYLTATATLDYGAIPDAGCLTDTITLTGAAAGDAVAFSLPPALEAGLFPGAVYVSASNTVSVRLCNASGDELNPASGSFKVAITR